MDFKANTAMHARARSAARLFLGLLVSACSAGTSHVPQEAPPLPNVSAATAPVVQSAPSAVASPIDAAPGTPVEVVDMPTAKASQPPVEGERDLTKPKTASAKPSAPKNAPPTSDAKASTPSGLPPDCEEPGIQSEIKLEELERVRGDGTVANEAVDQEFKKRRNAFKACYERELRRNPALRGTVRGEFTIDPSGRASNALVTGSTGQANLDSCVRQVVAGIRLASPPQGGGVTYRFSMSFATNGDPFRCFQECGLMPLTGDTGRSE